MDPKVSRSNSRQRLSTRNSSSEKRAYTRHDVIHNNEHRIKMNKDDEGKRERMGEVRYSGLLRGEEW